MKSFVKYKRQVIWFDFDECDRDLIDNSPYKLSLTFTGYIYYAKYIPRENGKQKHEKVFLHKVIAERIGLDINLEIDHINQDKLDNRRCNLRAATRKQNARNMKRNCRNTSGFKGVTWDKSRNKWLAQIKTDTNTKHLGRYDCPIEAYKAYCKAAKKYHGEFANFG